MGGSSADLITNPLAGFPACFKAKFVWLYLSLLSKFSTLFNALKSFVDRSASKGRKQLPISAQFIAVWHLSLLSSCRSPSSFYSISSSRVCSVVKMRDPFAFIFVRQNLSFTYFWQISTEIALRPETGCETFPVSKLPVGVENEKYLL